MKLIIILVFLSYNVFAQKEIVKLSCNDEFVSRFEIKPLSIENKTYSLINLELRTYGQRKYYDCTVIVFDANGDSTSAYGARCRENYSFILSANFLNEFPDICFYNSSNSRVVSTSLTVTFYSDDGNSVTNYFINPTDYDSCYYDAEFRLGNIDGVVLKNIEFGDDFERTYYLWQGIMLR